MKATDDNLGTQTVRIRAKEGLFLDVQGLHVTVESGPDKGRMVELDGPSVTIGTGSGNGLRLTDPSVSRRHAVLKTTPEGTFLEDLGSRNGTVIDGVSIQGAHVREGSRIRLGSTTLHVRSVKRRFTVLEGEPAPPPGVIAESPAMKEVLSLVREVARSHIPVLIQGETGSGKDVLARALHDLSSRSSRPYLVLDCGTATGDLMARELFGNEKGAFTGAESASPGILESVDGGTVFLDEIGELEPALQPKLLRAVEAREILRLGSTRPVSVNFRIAAATNRDLEVMVASGDFRPDLYYRIACITIRIPSLQERPEDILPLARHFLNLRSGETVPSQPLHLSRTAEEILMGHDWPGNVRQLRNALDAASAVCRTGTITEDDLGRVLPEARSAETPVEPSTFEQAERVVLVKALSRTGWNRRAAARELGISPTTLHKKIRQYGLAPPE